METRHLKQQEGYYQVKSETILLNKEDIYIISSDGPGADLTGSTWTSNYPVSVISGNMNANVPITNNGSNYLVEEDIPTYQWGTDYYVSTLQYREYYQ